MWKVAQRELATGFYISYPNRNEQLFGRDARFPEYKFVAEVVAYDAESQTATIRQRNVIHEGDQLSFTDRASVVLKPLSQTFGMLDGNKIDRALLIRWSF